MVGKSKEHSVNAMEEFTKLEQVLNQTADDSLTCLKLLKKNLSEYDSHNGNHLHHTGASYMRSDMRTAKDTAMEMKHVAKEINRSHKASKTEVHSARNTMDATAKAIENLKITARNYDKENHSSMGVKGRVEAAVGRDQDKKHGNRGGLFGTNEKDEGGYLGKNKEEESRGGFFGGDKEENRGGILGGNQHKGEHREDFLGGEKETHHHGGMLGGDDNNGGIMGSAETVETIVKKTLRDHFSLRALDHQISTAENSLSPSVIERAKDAMHGVKEKLTGDKTSPTHAGHHQTTHTVHP